jgi:hypothetical protein
MVVVERERRLMESGMVVQLVGVRRSKSRQEQTMLLRAAGVELVEVVKEVQVVF